MYLDRKQQENTITMCSHETLPAKALESYPSNFDLTKIKNVVYICTYEVEHT